MWINFFPPIRFHDNCSQKKIHPVLTSCMNLYLHSKYTEWIINIQTKRTLETHAFINSAYIFLSPNGINYRKKNILTSYFLTVSVYHELRSEYRHFHTAGKKSSLLASCDQKSCQHKSLLALLSYLKQLTNFPHNFMAASLSIFINLSNPQIWCKNC